MKYVLLISYDGTDFSGWQIQPGKRTVQGELGRAAEQIFGRPIAPIASGRTDAGVHALGQVAELEGETSIPPEKLRFCFNRLLPPDVRVRESAAAPEGFDCTRSAKRKTYLYRAYFAETELPLLDRCAAKLERRPSLERMREAAALLVGRHDFRAFRSAGFTSKTSERELYRVTVSRREEGGAELFEIETEGDGFLYNMVRILCGELFAVGCGKEEGISRAFRTGERAALAKTMPARGLLLKEVEYGAPLFGAKE